MLLLLLLLLLHHVHQRAIAITHRTVAKDKHTQAKGWLTTGKCRALRKKEEEQLGNMYRRLGPNVEQPWHRSF